MNKNNKKPAVNSNYSKHPSTKKRVKKSGCGCGKKRGHLKNMDQMD
ncbi:hypothetical protein [Metabacillus fastidiosus]